MEFYQQRELASPLCTSIRSLNTTYNGNKDVPPYVGYMFEMTAVSDVEVLTFELDIRWDLNPSDLSIEVYTFAGSYDIVMDKASAWDQLAGTYLVLSPEGNSAIIPAAEFYPVRISAGDKRSFYITMKGPYLDHTVYGLQHTGDVHVNGDDIILLVGSGFTSYKFSGVVDPVLSPQVAGIIHYKKTFGCDDPLASSTTIEYQFMFETNDYDDSALVANTNSAIDRTVDNLLVSNNRFKAYVREYGVTKRAAPVTTLVTYDYNCPSEWTACPFKYLNSRVTFNHKDNLDSGTLLYELYKAMSPFTKAVESIAPAGMRVLHLGYEGALAEFTIKMMGVPIGRLMDDVQKDYFRETSELFLRDLAEKTFVLSVEVDQQIVTMSSQTGRRGLVSESTLEVRGLMKGAIPEGDEPIDFSSAVSKTLHSNKDVFISLLMHGELRPGDIHEDGRLEYFRHISDMTSELVAINESSKGLGKKAVGGVLVGVFAGVSLLVGAYLLYRHRRNEKVRIRELGEYRKEMRERRRANRQEKQSLNSGCLAASDLPSSGSQVIEQCVSATVVPTNDPSRSDLSPPESPIDKCDATIPSSPSRLDLARAEAQVDTCNTLVPTNASRSELPIVDKCNATVPTVDPCTSNEALAVSKETTQPTLDETTKEPNRKDQQ